MRLDVPVLRRIPLTVIALVAWASTASAELATYRPKHRLASEIAALAAPLLAPDGTAIADPATQTVILKGEAKAIRAALGLLGSLDVPAAQYRIESEITTRQALRDGGFEVSGWIPVGDLSVSRLSGPERQLNVDVRSYATAGLHTTAAQVVVIEGRSAEIWTGQTIPVRIRHFDRRTGDEHILETSPLIPVRSGFQVWPRGLPDGQIELRVTPIQSSVGADQQIQETSASTLVRLRPGEQIAIGGIRTGTEVSTRQILGAESSGADRDQVILLRATRIEVPADAR